MDIPFKAVCVCQLFFPIIHNERSDITQFVFHNTDGALKL